MFKIYSQDDNTNEYNFWSQVDDNCKIDKIEIVWNCKIDKNWNSLKL